MPLRYLTAGESHGRALVGILEGMPAGLKIDVAAINHQLRRRQGGYGRGGRMRIEQDEVEILSGLRFGKMLGSPIALLVWNRDWENWSEQMDPFEAPRNPKPVTVARPGHADLAGSLKYRHRDIRNVLERSSARETTMRVAIASVARQFIQALGVAIGSHVVQLRDVIASTFNELDDDTRDIDSFNERADRSPVRCLDPNAETEMIARIDRAKREGNSVGGVFEVIATGVPIGLGSHVHWDRKLEGRITQAMMTIPAMKAVEIGIGREAAALWGAEVHDEIYYDEKHGFHRNTNNAGGIEGGMTSGAPVLVRVAMKPLSTLMRPLISVDLLTKQPVKAHRERSDVCAVPAASVIGEAILALVLADAFLEKFGGDSIAEVADRVEAWNTEVDEL
ncbi:MAG: chorismate synthase [Candidatus Bipolaricaulia bacterium]